MLTPDEKRLIDDAANTLYHVSKDERGVLCIDLYADYNDTNEELLQLAADNCRLSKEDASLLGTLEDILKREISEWYSGTIDQMQDDIIRKAGSDPLSEKGEEIREYLYNAYSFRVPYDHFLDQSMRVNLLLGTPEEVNLDFGSIRETYDALTGQLDAEDLAGVLSEKTALHWLVQQQGYTMQDLQKTMHDYTECFFEPLDDSGVSLDGRLSEFHNFHSFFLSSICKELENTTNFMNTIAVLTEVSMHDYCTMLQPGKELVLPKDTILGVFSPWLGGGSTLDIRLEKDLILPENMIWHVQVEGAPMYGQYSVDSVYGLVHNAWKKPLLVRDAALVQKEKSRLNDTIRSADDRCAKVTSADENDKGQPER